MSTNPSPLELARLDLDQRTLQLKNMLAQRDDALVPVLDLHHQDETGWVQPLRKVCFRSDTRDFNTIFQHGFIDKQTEKRYPRTIQDLQNTTISAQERDRSIRSLQYPELPHYRNPLHYFPEGERPKFDIDPASSVALTRRLGMAPIFPLDDKETVTWIYAVWVETAYMTYHRQVSDGKLGVAAAKEVAVRYVPPQHVIAAVQCTRAISKVGNVKQIRYTLGDTIHFNQKFANPGVTEMVQAKFERFYGVDHLIRWDWATSDITVESTASDELDYAQHLDITGIGIRPSIHHTNTQIGQQINYVFEDHVEAYETYRTAAKQFRRLGGKLTKEEKKLMG